MKQFSLGAVIGNMQLLMMSAFTMMATKTPDAELTDEDLDHAASILGTVRNVIEFAGLRDSCERIDSTAAWIRGAKNLLNKQALGVHLQNVCDTIRAEADKKKFVFIESDRSHYLGGYPFGLEVAVAFPRAVNDISQAGECLAFECSTACVFHLMRAVELGMRALCADLGMTKTKRRRKSGTFVYVPIEYSEWEKILDELQGKVDAKLFRLKRGAEKQKLQEFYYPALQDLRGFKDAWRNHVMHSRADYTREEAMAVFSHVERFMVNLSTRIGEV